MKPQRPIRLYYGGEMSPRTFWEKFLNGLLTATLVLAMTFAMAMCTYVDWRP